MIRKVSLLLLMLPLILSAFSQGQTAKPQTPQGSSASPAAATATAKPSSAASSAPEWVVISNKYANMLIAVGFKFHPEFASTQGLSQFDDQISQPTLANEDAERRETTAVLEKLKAASAEKQQQDVAEDLQIMIRRVNLNFRREDFERSHEVPYVNASQAVFSGVRILLDDQTPDARRPAAVVRIREYAGLEPGYTSLTEILKQRVTEQMARPGIIYPAKVEIETEMARNSNYLEGIPPLMQKYNLQGWQEAFDKLKTQLIDYDNWIKATVLPKARTDFRMPSEEYALALENYGIDIPQDKLVSMAHDAFIEFQGEMKVVAAKIAKERKLPSSDYRDVIRELKKQQLVGDAILPFYENRLKQIEKDHCRPADRQPARPSGEDPHRHGGGNRAAARAPHGASAVRPQHRTARRIRFTAEHSSGPGTNRHRKVR